MKTIKLKSDCKFCDEPSKPAIDGKKGKEYNVTDDTAKSMVRGGKADYVVSKKEKAPERIPKAPPAPPIVDKQKAETKKPAPGKKKD